jgi:ATP-dependent RNA helicase RhlE
MNQPSNGFAGLGIAPKLLDVLIKNKFTAPTPIQQQSIPFGIEGKDIIGIAQTGTGKTLAFGIPMLQRLARDGGQGLVVVPTRELAVQVDESLQKIGRSFGLKTAVLIGGENFDRQLRRLKAKAHIIIATPGRLIDHMERRTVKLETTVILVLDEADRMLDMGFMPQIKIILEKLPKKRQTMLFSATMPTRIVALAASHMQLPIRVEVAPAGSASKNVTQELFFVEKANKISVLETVLAEYRGSVLVFTRTKHEAKKIAKFLKTAGHKSAEIHSNRSLGQRREALEGFKVGRYRVLVATDIAARGIDVKGIELVINYDLPENAEDYVHRIGRTGRAESAGHAISFAMPHQQNDVKNIERLIKKSLPVRKGTKGTIDAPAPRPSSPSHSRSNFSRNRRPAPRNSKPNPGGNFRSTRAPYSSQPSTSPSSLAVSKKFHSNSRSSASGNSFQKSRTTNKPSQGKFHSKRRSF